MKTSGIYKITNNVTGDYYVGSSKDVMRRWVQHKSPSIWKQYPNKIIYKEMKLFGTDVFTLEVLEECENLLEREQYWIDVLKPTYNSKKSYNKKNHGVSAVYKITCTVTGDFYIGSSVNVKRRWAAHKLPSTWKHNPNKKLYKDFQKYGIEAFSFEILAEFPPEHLARKEQEAIETLHPTYNSQDAYVTKDSALLKQKMYKENHKNKLKAKKKAFYEAHREELKAYAEAHKKELEAKKKAYAEAHKEEHKAYCKAYYEAHKKELEAKKKAYVEAHKEELKAYMKGYREAHKEELKAKKKAYYEAHKNK